VSSRARRSADLHAGQSFAPGSVNPAQIVHFIALRLPL